jgi:tetratricopeptide (TPR) repeat protein
MFPAAILLYLWWKNGRVGRADWQQAAPFFGLSLGFGAVTVWFQTHRAIGDLPTDLGGPLARLLNSARDLWDYWLLLFNPSGHQPIYYAHQIHAGLGWKVLAASALVTMALAAAVRPAWRRGVAFGLGWFVLNLIPVLGFAPMSYLRIAPVADHFLYISSLGIIGLAAAALEFMPRSRSAPRVSRSTAGLQLAAAITLVAFGVVAAREAHRYAGAFITDEAYWSRAVRWPSGSWLAYDNLGSALLRRHDARGALAPLREAGKLNPGAAEVSANLSVALLQTGDLDGAVTAGYAAVRAEPGFATGHYNLANALIAQGRKPAAIEHYQNAVRLEPESVEFHYNLANALADSGDLPGAARELQAAVSIEPRNFAAQYNLGNVLAALDRMDAAVNAFRAAVALRPSSAEAHNCLGDALAAMRRPSEAAEEHRVAHGLRPAESAGP